MSGGKGRGKEGKGREEKGRAAKKNQWIWKQLWLRVTALRLINDVQRERRVDASWRSKCKKKWKAKLSSEASGGQFINLNEDKMKW